MFQIETALQQYGAAAVFLGTIMEGEVALMLGAIASGEGWLTASHVFLLAWAGSFCGDQATFHISKRWGGRICARRPHWRERIDIALEKIAKNDILYILLLRFMVGCRSVGLVAAGLSSLRSLRFLWLGALATFLWTSAIFTLGYIGGRVALLWFRETPLPLLIGAVIVVLCLAWLAQWGVRALLAKR